MEVKEAENMKTQNISTARLLLPNNTTKSILLRCFNTGYSTAKICWFFPPNDLGFFSELQQLV